MAVRAVAARRRAERGGTEALRKGERVRKQILPGPGRALPQDRPQAGNAEGIAPLLPPDADPEAEHDRSVGVLTVNYV